MALPKTSKITIARTSGLQKIKKLEIKRVDEPVVSEEKRASFWSSLTNFLAVGGDFV